MRRRGPVRKQVLFVQGGGAGTHDEWDDRLVASLRRALGPEPEVRYPRLPDEDAPGLATWGPVIRTELAALAPGAVVVGHSLGATLLVQALLDPAPLDQAPLDQALLDQAPLEPPLCQDLAALVLLGAPFVGPGGWPAEDALPDDLGARLPLGAEVHVVHGLDDETVPPSHAELYARVVPQAQLHLLPGRDHQLGDDLREVAQLIARLPGW